MWNRYNYIDGQPHPDLVPKFVFEDEEEAKLFISGIKEKNLNTADFTFVGATLTEIPVIRRRKEVS
jgi:hypothetical protein